MGGEHVRSVPGTEISTMLRVSALSGNSGSPHGPTEESLMKRLFTKVGSTQGIHSNDDIIMLTG